jgi:hypothetical protein
MTVSPRLTLLVTGALATAGLVAVGAASFGPQLPAPDPLPSLPSRLGDTRLGPPSPQPLPTIADRRVRAERRRLQSVDGEVELVLVQAVVRLPEQRSVSALTKDTTLQLKGGRPRRLGTDQVLIGRLADRAALQTCVTPKGAAASRQQLSRLAPDGRLPSLAALVGLAPQPVPGCLLVSLQAESQRGAAAIGDDPSASLIQAWTLLRPVLIPEPTSPSR